MRPRPRGRRSGPEHPYRGPSPAEPQAIEQRTLNLTSGGVAYVKTTTESGASTNQIQLADVGGLEVDMRVSIEGGLLPAGTKINSIAPSGAGYVVTLNQNITFASNTRFAFEDASKVASLPKPAPRVTPAGGDDDWETF